MEKGELPLWTDIYSEKSYDLYNYLKRKKITCRHFWDPINSMKTYKKNFKNLIVSKKLKNKLMWLPSSLTLSKKELKYICSNINNFFKKN